MRDYWQNLTSREQLLIGVAGGLALLVLMYFLLVRPLQAYSTESAQAYASADHTFRSVQLKAAQLKAAEQTAGDTADGAEPVSLRVAVSRAARQSGVAISRLQPSEDGALTVWVENAQSAALYGWLQRLAEEQGVGPSNVLIQKTSSGEGLRAQVRFVGVGS